MKKRNRYLIALLFTSLFSFFLLESYIPFTETSDARYCEIAYETLVYNHWLIPTQNKILHITKPPLTYWLTALGYKLLGVNESGARFFAALFGTLCVFLVFLIAFEVFKDEDRAFVSAFVFATMPLIIIASRIVTTDIFLLTFVLMSFYFFLKLYGDNRRIFLYLFWISLGLTGLTKGPIGFFEVLPVIILWGYIARELDFVKSVFKPIPIFLSLIIGFWWFFYIFLNIPNSFNYLFGKQLMSRFSSHGFGHPKPFYFFIEVLLYAAYPFVFVFIFLLRERFSNIKKNKMLTLIFISFIYPIILFSIPKSKLSLYILLSLASLSILVSHLLFNREKKCAVFNILAVFEIAIVLWFYFFKHIPLNFFTSLITIIVLAINISIFLINSNKILLIFSGIKNVTIFLILLTLIAQSPEKYLFTMKTTANFINKLPSKPDKVYLVGFNSRSFILYTGIHPIETRFDKEFIYSDPETKKVLIHIDDLLKKWKKEKKSIAIVRKKETNKYLKLLENSKVIFLSPRFSVISHR